MADKPKIDPYAAGFYGGYPQQYGPAQYVQPKKKFPWLWVILISILGLALIGVGLFFVLAPKGPKPDLVTSPSFLTLQVSPGQSSERTITISNPTKKTIQTTLDTSTVPDWIILDKRSITLDPGTSTEITLSYDVPSTAKESSGLIFLSNSDQIINFDIKIAPPPLMEITLSNEKLNLLQGSRTGLLITLKNAGESPAVNSSFSFSGIPNYWIVEDISAFNVDAGNEVSKTITLSIPKKEELGTYQGILTVEGLGFLESQAFSVVIGKSLGELTLSPSDLTGDQSPGTNKKLIVKNDGNGDLKNVSLIVSTALTSTITVSPNTIPLLEAGQDSEVIMTIGGTNGTKNGNLKVVALDTHDNVQTKFVTIAINVLSGGSGS